MAIREQKKKELEMKLKELGILEKDIKEQFVTGSGKGGQKQNKTANKVILTHIPTEIIIHCQKDRSRENNRFFARRTLCERIESLDPTKQNRKELLIKKIKKQKDRQKRKQKKKDRTHT